MKKISKSVEEVVDVFKAELKKENKQFSRKDILILLTIVEHLREVINEDNCEQTV